MPDGGTTRRGFVIAALASLAAAGAKAEDPEATKPSVTDDTMASAERLADVLYTPAERQQMLESLDEHLENLRARRSFAPPMSLAPAQVFDPRLPGGRYGPEQSGVNPSQVRAPLPTQPEDIAYAPLTHLSHWLRKRKITSVRLTELYLDRLERLGPELQCLITLTRDLALEQARAADAELAAGRWRGPLHGVPWGAKDLLDTAGITTTWGATPHRKRVPEADATVVRRLREAGAVLVAKLTLGALAYGDIWFDGQTRNPWNPAEGSSGSSAGSAAAVAAGLVGFAIGTETYGSIVSPSMRCGVTGLRPTFGRVSRAGAMPLCWSLDKIGAMARTVEDTVLVLDALRGADPADPSAVEVPLAFDPTAPVADLRVGYDPAWFEADATDLDRAVLDMLRSAGVALREVSVPELPYDALLLVLLAEAAAAHEPITLDGRDDQLVWQDADAWPNSFRLARFIPAVDLVQADRLRRRVMVAFDELFQSVEALVSPSFAGPLLLATNYTGHPSLTLRVGFEEVPTRIWPPSLAEGRDPDPTPHRVPHGITLWGRLFDEGTLCRLGMAIETAAGVARERPPMLDGGP
jgi:Asp-tRNA(Asn)/Glu-tRNA(Gln) amidotransferase A subunit family amidase